MKTYKSYIAIYDGGTIKNFNNFDELCDFMAVLENEYGYDFTYKRTEYYHGSVSTTEFEIWSDDCKNNHVIF